MNDPILLALSKSLSEGDGEAWFPFMDRMEELGYPTENARRGCFVRGDGVQGVIIRRGDGLPFIRFPPEIYGVVLTEKRTGAPSDWLRFGDVRHRTQDAIREYMIVVDAWAGKVETVLLRDYYRDTDQPGGGWDGVCGWCGSKYTASFDCPKCGVDFG